MTVEDVLNEFAKENVTEPVMDTWKELKIKEYFGTNDYRFSVSEIERAVSLAFLAGKKEGMKVSGKRDLDELIHVLESFEKRLSEAGKR